MTAGPTGRVYVPISKTSEDDFRGTAALPGCGAGWDTTSWATISLRQYVSRDLFRKCIYVCPDKAVGHNNAVYASMPRGGCGGGGTFHSTQLHATVTRIYLRNQKPITARPKARCLKQKG